MILSSGVARKSSAVHICCANFLVRFNETPLKLVFRNKSYRLQDSISKTKHRWFRNMKWRFKCTLKKRKKLLNLFPDIQLFNYMLEIICFCYAQVWLVFIHTTQVSTGITEYSYINKKRFYKTEERLKKKKTTKKQQNNLKHTVRLLQFVTHDFNRLILLA